MGWLRQKTTLQTKLLEISLIIKRGSHCKSRQYLFYCR
jgi:hypothetical protein